MQTYRPEMHWPYFQKTARCCNPQGRSRPKIIWRPVVDKKQKGGKVWGEVKALVGDRDD